MLLKKINLLFIFLLLFQLQCKSQKVGGAYSSETLKIIRISENVYKHVTYLQTDEYGKVACNGLIYLKNNEAVVFDTPSKDKVSEELLTWLMKDKKSTVKAVVVNHFHIDCLGGLETFHNHEIPSYAHTKTIALAEKDGATVPQIGFEAKNELQIGGEKIRNTHFGEAHTQDNIISYIPSKELIFGGCMVKSLKAPEGNLADANLSEWSNTIENIKAAYPNLRTVVPGHGKHGGIELLDYTIELFKTK